MCVISPKRGNSGTLAVPDLPPFQHLCVCAVKECCTLPLSACFRGREGPIPCPRGCTLLHCPGYRSGVGAPAGTSAKLGSEDAAGCPAVPPKKGQNLLIGVFLVGCKDACRLAGDDVFLYRPNDGAGVGGGRRHVAEAACDGHGRSRCRDDRHSQQRQYTG